jgi:hypothetical protein
MRDGTSISGTVLSSSTGEIKVDGDDHVQRTIQMSQVRSVDYGAVPPPAAGAPTANAGNPPPAPANGAAPADGAPAPDPVHDQHFHPEEAAITSKTYVVPEGTALSVRTEETIDSAKAAEGQTFAAEVTKSVKDSAGDVVIPRGANAQIIIRSASKGGHFHGASDLVLDLNSVAVNGRMYQLDTVDLAMKGKDGVGANKRTAKFAGGGAAVGALIGVIAGGGKGAAIGAGSGAGAGVVGELVTKSSVKVPVESVLTFKLEKPIQVTAAQ